MERLTPAMEAAALGCDRPTYLYDLSILRRQCETIESIDVQLKRIFFASMANDYPPVLTAIRSRGHGVFVNSPRHLRLALSLGFGADQIVYAASNMTVAEMAECSAAGVHLVLDSISQIEQLAQVRARPRALGLRVNVGSCLDAAAIEFDPAYRFGVLPNEIARAIERASSLNLVIGGIHSYFGTDIDKAETLLEGMRRLCDVAAQFPDLWYVDVGGGFSPSARRRSGFDFPAYSRGAAELLSGLRSKRGRPITLFVEPGRFLAAACGAFVVTVVDVKERADRTFVGTNGSIAIFPRPLFYPDKASHGCQLLGAAGPLHERPIEVCGNSTYSRDFLARGVAMPLPRVGDKLALLNAGAYCRSMMTDFLGKDRPHEVVLDTAEADDIDQRTRCMAAF